LYTVPRAWTEEVDHCSGRCNFAVTDDTIVLCKIGERK
jgi:hypothetical protein